MKNIDKTKEQLLNEIEILKAEITECKKNKIERKIVEEKSHKEINLSRTLLQASPAFLVAINSEGKTILMNKTMIDVLGYKTEEVIGKEYITNFVPERNRENLSVIFNELVKHNKKTLNENYIMTRDGKEILIEWHGVPVFTENGKFDYFIGIGIDITDRKNTEKELAKHREHLEKLVKERTAELTEKNIKLEHFNKLFVDREFRIKELKNKVEELEKRRTDK